MPENRDGAGRFQKGQSGNPGGRARNAFAETIRSETRDGAELVTLALAIARSPEEDTTDRLRAIGWLADRGFGKAVQQVEVGGDPEKPLVFELSPAKLAKAKEILDAATSSDEVHPA